MVTSYCAGSEFGCNLILRVVILQPVVVEAFSVHEQPVNIIVVHVYDHRLS